jgi:hypothetical protein
MLSTGFRIPADSVLMVHARTWASSKRRNTLGGVSRDNVPTDESNNKRSITMFERMYKDEEDNWQEVTEEEVRKRLDGYYHSIDLAIEAMKEGIPHDTPFAIFRYTSE